MGHNRNADPLKQRIRRRRRVEAKALQCLTLPEPLPVDAGQNRIKRYQEKIRRYQKTEARLNCEKYAALDFKTRPLQKPRRPIYYANARPEVVLKGMKRYFVKLKKWMRKMKERGHAVDLNDNDIRQLSVQIG